MKSTNGTGRRLGFTLVEVLVVVAIIAIVTSVMVVVVGAVNEKAKVSRVQSQMTMLGNAVDAFKEATGQYPLAVPYDAWGGTNWAAFVGVVDGGDWTDYFKDANTDGQPDWDIWTTSEYPTNIQMLTFQLEQVPESNSILARIKENTGAREQVKFVPTGTTEKWELTSDTCELKHPLDTTATTYRKTFQPLDPWGRPLRYWNANTLKWAKENVAKVAWSASVQQLLAEKLQQANWGFYIESAGKDGLFGWYGAPSVTVDAQQTEDNVYSSK
jgi:prepilin-type N-terminal cleavage/methylation domain-containing protein